MVASVALGLLSSLALAQSSPQVTASHEFTTAVAKVFDGRQRAIEKCVRGHATKSDDSRSQVVRVTVVVNGEGQLFSLGVALEPLPPNSDPITACVDKALRSTSWPHPESPIATSERSWIVSRK